MQISTYFKNSSKNRCTPENRQKEHAMNRFIFVKAKLFVFIRLDISFLSRRANKRQPSLFSPRPPSTPFTPVTLSKGSPCQLCIKSCLITFNFAIIFDETKLPSYFVILKFLAEPLWDKSSSNESEFKAGTYLIEETFGFADQCRKF